MPALYPLRFEPILKRYIWGGRRLATVLDKSLGEGDDYAESWEVCDHGDDQSRVAAGPLAGATLAQLVRDRGDELLGRHHPQARFPLLFKFLDAHRTLSVQVHPDDAQAARLDPPDLGKTEAWVVLAAEPAAVIYAGLKRGFDRPAFEREVERGTIELCLHQIKPIVGDCIFLPAGTVHALGEGLVVAEIQQSSDTTYRLYDWNRLGTDGKPRPLHIAQALDVIDYQREPLSPQEPQVTDAPGVERLVQCDKFVLDRWTFDRARTLGGDRRAHIVAVTDGAIELERDAAAAPLSKGNTTLIPASAGSIRLTPIGRAEILDAYLP